MVAINVVLLILLGLSISFVWTSFLGAPWVPTPMKMVHKMLGMAEVGPEDLVFDLGCGDGRIIVTAARHYGARAVGIEIDPLRYLWCRALIAVLGLNDRVKIVYGNLFSQDLSDADVVTCFLSQSTNLQLETKLKHELRPGTRVVSHRFSFPGLYKVSQYGDARLYLCNFENPLS
ncbi:MAG: methyltransferase domain-containing protein [Anaerolineales bacterium]|nr:methyltransferase domain-containing protein [Anaerolineales bacterium]